MSGKARKRPRARLTPAKRRALILEAGAELFSKHGFDKTSMRAIASAAGVTTPVLYDHFKSKADLYTTLLQMHADALIAHWAFPADISNPEQLFMAAISAFLEWIEEHEQGWRMLLLDAPDDPKVAAAHRRIQARATRASAVLFSTIPNLKVSARIGRARVDELYAKAVITAVNGIVVWWWENRDLSREQVLALTRDIFWRGLGEVSE